LIHEAGRKVKPMADKSADSPAADAAIACVLRAEADAAQAVQRARAETLRIAEQARAEARATAERAERRIRAVVAAHESELAERLAQIELEASRLDAPAPPSTEERAALLRAVAVLARQLVGGPT
jgi:hypothetical protein